MGGLGCRMSPTEFSNYIKQRAMQQQLHQQPPHHSPGRALSPDPSAYYFPHGPYGPQFSHRSMFESSNQFLSPDLYSGKVPFEHTPAGPFYPNNGTVNVPASAPATPQDSGKLIDNNWSYPTSGQYQHLLVAN